MFFAQCSMLENGKSWKPKMEKSKLMMWNLKLWKLWFTLSTTMLFRQEFLNSQNGQKFFWSTCTSHDFTKFGFYQIFERILNQSERSSLEWVWLFSIRSRRLILIFQKIVKIQASWNREVNSLNIRQISYSPDPTTNSETMYPNLMLSKLMISFYQIWTFF